MSAAAPVLERLVGVVAVGRGRWAARCPKCDEPLMVTQRGELPVLLVCSGGCTGRAIRAALGLPAEAA